MKMKFYNSKNQVVFESRENASSSWRIIDGKTTIEPIYFHYDQFGNEFFSTSGIKFIMLKDGNIKLFYNEKWTECKRVK